MTFIILTIWLVLMVTALSLAVQVIQVHKQGNKRSWENLRNFYKRSKRYKYHSKASRLAYTSPGFSGLWHQLLIRVNFDVATAERLVNALRRKYPHKDERWCIEKAIYDLERDRRR